MVCMCVYMYALPTMLSASSLWSELSLKTPQGSDPSVYLPTLLITSLISPYSTVIHLNDFLNNSVAILNPTDTI